MTTRFAILCPGQGGQHAAMFDLVRTDPLGAQIFDEIGLTATLPLDAVLHDNAQLFSNAHAQPLIVAAGLTAWEVIRRALPPPTLVAGYSVGEMTACGVADALSPAQMVALARARAQTMEAARLLQPHQGLMSVSGIPVSILEAEFLAHGGIANQHDVWLAIETGYDTAIVGGDTDALQTIGPVLNAAGAHTGLLPVEIASHTPLMAAAVAPFAQALTDSAFRTPTVPVLAGVSGQAGHRRDDLVAALEAQLTHPIRWRACMDACAEQGVTVALELGPGAALSRMLRERHPHIEARSLAEFRSLDGAVRWLRSRLGIE